MKSRFDKYLPYVLLFIFLVILATMAVLSEGSFGGADDISHFKYSRYAFKKPELFLDTWGKPLFTMVMAPFAQFGHNGVKIFNVLLGLGAALLTYLTAKKLNYKHPVLALFLVTFAPLYTVVMITGLTEILFSFILMLGIYLFFSNRSLWSCVVISLLPFVRNEGFIIFPSFLLAYIINRQWKAIPFILTGFLVFSLIGSFHYNDFFWMINENPYTGTAVNIYGSGELLHFVNQYVPIFGLPLFVLVLVGLAYIPVYFFTTGKGDKYPFINEVLVAYSPFLIYFAAHSYVWWQGIGNSGGSIKVMVAVLPSAALLALFGWNGLMRWLPLPKYMKIALAVLLASLLTVTAFRVHKYPVELSRTQQVLKGAAQWLKGSEYADRKLYYWDPHWWFFLEIDPTDRDRISQYVPDAISPHRHIPVGALVLWDAHFGPNEGTVKLNSLWDNPYFRLINVFRPDPPFKVLGGQNYEIFIFERTDGNQEKDNDALLEEILIRKASEYKYRIVEQFDFEDVGAAADSLGISSDIVYAGSYSFRMNEAIEFCPAAEMAIGDLNAKESEKLSFSLAHYFDKLSLGEYPLLVLSVQNTEEIYFYQTWEIKPAVLNQWEVTTFEQNFPEWDSPDDILKVYVWNRARQRFCLDDLTISLKEPLKGGLN